MTTYSGKVVIQRDSVGRLVDCYVTDGDAKIFLPITGIEFAQTAHDFGDYKISLNAARVEVNA